MAHQKHVKLKRPEGGKFGRTELSILGAPCGEIKQLVKEVIANLNDEFRIAYLDADHNAKERTDWSALEFGAAAQLTNKITHFTLETTDDKGPYFNEYELVLINGNHYKATKQIAWVHPKKSLEQKLDKLTSVGLVILEEGEELPKYLKEHLDGSEYIIIDRQDTSSLTSYIKQYMATRIPTLKGLVLVGGKSQRMNKDKSQLVFHQAQPQYKHLYNLLQKYCDEVFISVRDDEQAKDFDEDVITDKFVGLGPYGGIMSAFQQDPNAAWLVVAVDLPFLNDKTINTLVNRRNISKSATCFIDRFDEFPEPLITIWEPRAYPILLNFLSKGYSCPRKTLINTDTEIIRDRDVKALTNVNNPAEYESAVKEING